MNSLDRWATIKSAWESRRLFDSTVEANFVVAERLIGFPTQELYNLYERVSQVFDQFWQEYKLIRSGEPIHAWDVIPEDQIADTLLAKAVAANQVVAQFVGITAQIPQIQVAKAKAEAANNFVAAAQQNCVKIEALLKREDTLKLLAQNPLIRNGATDAWGKMIEFNMANDWSTQVLAASRLNGAHMRLERLINENLDLLFNSIKIN
ncbi:MAG: hypothetical protein JSS32_07340 [Verrucomicrobia bacterium]|nr:hypothetical protein [Verrucomicrobiota bacterium]